MKIYSNTKPEKIENIGNGNYFFNYNIEEYIEDDIVKYKYDQLELNNYPTYDVIVSYIIKNKFDYDFREAAVRKGIINSNDSDFILFNSFAEETKQYIKNILND